MECKKEENRVNCNCSYSCENKGMCCKCISYHRNRGEFPACYFPNDIERTYDRTVENFIKMYNERGKCW